MPSLLIIEDEEILAKNIARYFEKPGHTADVVHDGAEGVETVFGEISSENMTMQGICRSFGFQIKHDLEDTTVMARLRI